MHSGGCAVRVVADDRECKAAVVEDLARCDCVSLQIERLPVGDYLVDDRFLFERKTLPDLALSIKSGRLFKQALRLAEAGGVWPAMVLEGTSRDFCDSGMRWEAVQGALITISLFVGLPILRTRTPEETLKTFLYAARQRRRIAHGALPRRGHRPKGKEALQSHIIQSLPGIGPERAERLIKRFGNVRAVFAADERALAEVAGIGERLARKIDWTVEEAPADYVALT